MGVSCCKELGGRKSLKSELLQGYYLGDFYVEPLSGQVTGKGVTTHLPPKAAEVLLCLAHSPGELVTREALLEQVWGEGHGSSETLSHAIGEIRHALDDHADDPHYIQTLPRRGYRLAIAPDLPTDRTEGSGHFNAPPATDDSGFSGFAYALVRHGVIQATAAYLVAGWLLLQVADVTFDNLGLPSWAQAFVTFTVVGGFPIVIALSWFFELAQGRLTTDSGDQSGKFLAGLEGNYLAVIAAFVIAAGGAGVYQTAVGFDVGDEPAPVANLLDDPALIPVAEDSIAVLPVRCVHRRRTQPVVSRRA